MFDPAALIPRFGSHPNAVQAKSLRDLLSGLRGLIDQGRDVVLERRAGSASAALVVSLL